MAYFQIWSNLLDVLSSFTLRYSKEDLLQFLLYSLQQLRDVTTNENEYLDY